MGNICAFGVWTAILSETGITLGSLEVAGFCVFVTGLAIEMIADLQKAAFKKQSQKDNSLNYISSGLWAYSSIPIILVKFWFGRIGFSCILQH